MQRIGFCHDCVHYNGARGEMCCDFCDTRYYDYYEPKEEEENEDGEET